jgi:hypothetical protein
MKYDFPTMKNHLYRKKTTMSQRRFDVDLLLDLFISAKAFKAADL